MIVLQRCNVRLLCVTAFMFVAAVAVSAQENVWWELYSSAGYHPDPTDSYHLPEITEGVGDVSFSLGAVRDDAERFAGTPYLSLTGSVQSEVFRVLVAVREEITFTDWDTVAIQHSTQLPPAEVILTARNRGAAVLVYAQFADESDSRYRIGPIYVPAGDPRGEGIVTRTTWTNPFQPDSLRDATMRLVGFEVETISTEESEPSLQLDLIDFIWVLDSF